MKKLNVLFAFFLIAMLVYSCEYIGSDMAEVSVKFFKSAKKGNFTEAYEYTSSDFKRAITQDEMEEFLKTNGFVKYKDASWSDRSVENLKGTLKGTVETDDGGEIPLTVQFIKENEEWKILRIETDKAGVETASGKTGELPMPSDNEIKNLAKSSVYDLAVAVQAKNFGAFYGNIATLWQGQTTKEDLMKNFKIFIDQKIDFTHIKNHDAVLTTKPMIDNNNILQFEGYFPGDAFRTIFKLKYVYEHPVWKLAGISVETKVD